MIDLDIGNPFFSGIRARMSFSELVAVCEMNYQRVAKSQDGQNSVLKLGYSSR